MNWDRIEGNRAQFTSNVTEQWDEFNEDQLARRVREKYGTMNEDDAAQRPLTDWQQPLNEMERAAR